jgi:hypothetical protein
MFGNAGSASSMTTAPPTPRAVVRTKPQRASSRGASGRTKKTATDWLAELIAISVPSWPWRSRMIASTGHVMPEATPATAAQPIAAASERRI